LTKKNAMICEHKMYTDCLHEHKVLIQVLDLKSNC